MNLQNYRCWHWLFSLAIPLLLWLAGCGERETSQAGATDSDGVVATVGDARITRRDVEREATRRAATGKLPVNVAQLVLEMAERNAMLQLAKVELADDAEVQREIENLLLSRWRDQEREVGRAAYDVSETDLRTAYAAEPAAWQRPAQARLAMLFRKLSDTASDSERTEVRTALERAVAQYRADPAAATQKGRMQGFGTIAAENSEDTVSRYRGGDLGWLENKPTAYHWPQEVLTVGFALSKGEVSTLIEAPGGLYVVMKSDERPAVTVPFAEAAVSLRRRLLKQKREAADQALLDKVRAKSAIQILTNRLEGIKLPANATGGVTLPGMLPTAEKSGE